ncbi:MAG: tetratricopeptide repeat protein, partial [Gemmataceae bacterium]
GTLSHVGPDRVDKPAHDETQPGTFLDFHLVKLLGKGAFGQVFLARQDRLAHRLVVLKIGSKLFSESQALAKLQHTNIVPIYALYQAGAMQAVCMPYLGATTLADVLERLRAETLLPTAGRFLTGTLGSSSSSCSPFKQRLEQASHVEAVLEIVARLANGLAYAHARGIVHRDLKPANILLSDEAEPMLLDFSLSQDLKNASLADALIGGTLPYMAPEQLDAFCNKSHATDARSDIYSLGIILYQLLTGRFPFRIPQAPIKYLSADLFADRRGTPPRLRELNPSISPAVEAIVRHCLEADPERRYQSAAELETDLRCQLENRPLRHAQEPSVKERTQKWLRRHPRLASNTSIALVGGAMILVMLGLYLARGRHLERLQVAEEAAQLLEDVRLMQCLSMQQRRTEPAARASLVDRAVRLVAHPYLGDKERGQIQQNTGDLLLTAARLELDSPRSHKADVEAALCLNQTAERLYGAQVPAVLWQQRVHLLHGLGHDAEARAASARAQPLATTARDLGLQATEFALQGKHQAASQLLERATRLEPRNFRAWFDLGICYEQMGRAAAASACFNACIALAPDFGPLYFRRGLSFLRQQQHDLALADFELSLRLSGQFADELSRELQAEVRLHRALALLGLNRSEAALEEIERALEAPRCPTRAHFIKARILEQLGEHALAARAQARGLSLTPADEMSWLARGNLLVVSDPQKAMHDFDQALRLNPACRTALQNKAHVLAERLGRLEEAIAVLDRLIELEPQGEVLGGRGVLLARLGQREPALRDARACLRAESSPRALYQAACIYALTSRERAEDAEQAMVLLAAALAQGYGQELFERDEDLAPIRAHAGFARLRPRPPAAAAP